MVGAESAKSVNWVLDVPTVSVLPIALQLGTLCWHLTLCVHRSPGGTPGLRQCWTMHRQSGSLALAGGSRVLCATTSQVHRSGSCCQGHWLTLTCWVCTDLSSTNGTFLNRGRLRPLLPVEIKPGDVIAFGVPRLCLHLETAEIHSQSDQSTCAGTLQSAFRVVQALSSKDFKW